MNDENGIPIGEQDQLTAELRDLVAALGLRIVAETGVDVASAAELSGLELLGTIVTTAEATAADRRLMGIVALPRANGELGVQMLVVEREPGEEP